jgi:hypothetical protein
MGEGVHAVGRQRALAMLLSLALTWPWPQHAYSQVSPSLRWHAAAGCPDAAAGQKAIDDLLEPRGLRGLWHADVSVTITQRPDLRWQAQVAIRDKDGVSERRLDGARCSSVAEAAALVAAMALDTIAASERVANPTSAARTPPLAAAPANDDALGVTLGARAAFDVGSLPLPSAGVAAVLGFQLGALRLSTDVTFWLPRLASGPDAGGGAEIGLVSVALRGCYRALRVAEQLGLEACVAAEAGFARGDGVGLLDIAQQRAPWVAAFAGLSLRQDNRSGLGAGLSLEVGAPLFRPEYVVTNFGVVFRATPVVGRIMIDVAWSFR